MGVSDIMMNIYAGGAVVLVASVAFVKETTPAAERVELNVPVVAPIPPL